MSVLMLSLDLMFSSQVSHAVRPFGATCLMASSAENLLTKTEANPPRLIIIDLDLRGVNCASLLPKLRTLSSSPAVVAYASHVHESKLVEANQAGCDEVMSRGQFHKTLPQLLSRFLSPPAAHAN